MKDSHLSVESQQGKPTNDKAKCEWCRAPYKIELSDAQDQPTYCSRDCERLDLDILDAYRRYE